MNPGYPFSISIFIPDSNTSALFYPNSNNIEALIPPGNVSLSHLSYLINCHIDYLKQNETVKTGSGKYQFFRKNF